MGLFLRSLTDLRRIARLAREDYEKNVQYLLSRGWTVIQCPACDNALYAKDLTNAPPSWDCPCGVKGMHVRRR